MNYYYKNFTIDNTQAHNDVPTNPTDSRANTNTTEASDDDSLLHAFDDSEWNNNITMNSRESSTMNVTINNSTNKKRLDDKQRSAHTINDVQFGNSNGDSLSDLQSSSKCNSSELTSLSRHSAKLLPNRNELNVKPSSEKAAVPVQFLRQDYLPRDKIDDKHIISVIGHRIKFKKALIEIEKKKMNTLKRNFLNYARPKVIQGYVSAAQHCCWKVKGQDVSNFNDVRAYISQNPWDEDLQRDIHYISYLRFTNDPYLYKWDEKLDNNFREENNIEYVKANDRKENGTNIDPTEISNTRGCFTILAVSLKTDYNKRLRTVCEKIHGSVVKQRRSKKNDKEKEIRRRSTFNFSTDMVVKRKEVQEKVFPFELLKLREENENLKNKIAVLKQSNQNTTTSTNDEVRIKHPTY